MGEGKYGDMGDRASSEEPGAGHGASREERAADPLTERAEALGRPVGPDIPESPGEKRNFKYHLLNGPTFDFEIERDKDSGERDIELPF